MNTITRDELYTQLHQGSPLKLVAVLTTWNYQKQRIPSSLHFTSVEEALSTLQPDDDIVLYCAGWPCLNSTWAYRLLEKHGYTKLRLYQEGLADWVLAGLPVEEEKATTAQPAHLATSS